MVLWSCIDRWLCVACIDGVQTLSDIVCTPSIHVITKDYKGHVSHFLCTFQEVQLVDPPTGHNGQVDSGVFLLPG